MTADNLAKIVHQAIFEESNDPRKWEDMSTSYRSKMDRAMAVAAGEIAQAIIEENERNCSSFKTRN